jgi:outer membrane protein
MAAPRHFATGLLLVACLALPAAVPAQTTGDWALGGRVVAIFTDATTAEVPGTGARIAIDGAASAAIDATTWITDHWSLEVMLTTASHDLTGVGGATDGLDVGRVWASQSTIILQYRFPLWSAWQPYVGLGLGLAYLHSSDMKGEIESLGIERLRSDLLTGVAVQAGVAYRHSRRWIFSLDVKYTGAGGEVRLKGPSDATLSSLDLDLEPWIVGLGAAYRF